MIESKHGTIANVRGRGLLVGFDLVEPDTRKLLSRAGCVDFFKRCLAGGLVLMGYAPRVRIHPPLILRPAEASRGLEILDRALAPVG